MSLRNALAALVCACSHPPPPPPPAPPPPPVPTLEQLLRLVTPSDGVRTADGGWLYASWPTGVTQLYHRDGQQVRQLTRFPDGLHAYRISPDRRRALLQAAPAGTEQWDVYVLDIASGVLESLLEDPAVRIDEVLWAPDGGGFLYSANAPSAKDFYLYWFSLSSHESRLEVQAPGLNVPAAFAPDGRRFAWYAYRAVNDSDGWIKEVGTEGNGTRVFASKGDARFVPAGFTAAGDLVVETNAGSDYAFPALFAPGADALQPLARKDWPLESLRVSASGRTLAWVYNIDGASELTVRTADGRPLPGPDERPGLLRLDDLSDRHVAYTFESGARPAAVYDWDLEDRRRVEIAGPEWGSVAPSVFLEPRLVRVLGFDGAEIPVYLFEPPGPGPHPFVVYVHGGPEGQFRPYFSRLFQYLLHCGLGVAAPNVRGSTGYGKAFAEADNYRKRMDSVKDLESVTRELVRLGLTRPGQLGIVGGSYGGFMVLAAITEYPDLFSAAVDFVGIVDFVNFLKNTKPYRRALREAEYGPLSDEEFLRSISPRHKLDRVRTPLFVVHGRNDPRVPVSEAEEVFRTLNDLGREVEYLVFEDEGHGIAKLENRLVFYPRMAEFLKRRLGGR